MNIKTTVSTVNPYERVVARGNVASESLALSKENAEHNKPSIEQLARVQTQKQLQQTLQARMNEHLTSIDTQLPVVEPKNPSQQLTAEQALKQFSDNMVSPENEKLWQDHAQAVQDSYNTAWQLDLAKMHYQQQKDLFDTYMQSSGVETSSNQSSNSLVQGSTVSSLTDMYTSLYQLHEKIKELEEAASKTPTILPINAAATSSAMATEQRVVRAQQINAYVGVANGDKTSFLQMSA